MDLIYIFTDGNISLKFYTLPSLTSYVTLNQGHGLKNFMVNFGMFMVKVFSSPEPKAPEELIV